MKKSILFKKTSRLIIHLLLFSLLLHGLLYITTGDPAISFLRKIGVQTASKELVEETRNRLGMNGHFFEDYLHWLQAILKGDFGKSFMTNKSVLAIIKNKLLISTRLIGGGFLLSCFFSLTLGSLLGNVSSIRWLKPILSLLLSLPIYLLAIFTIFIFGVQLRWFPFIGSSTSNHYILPLMVIALSEGSYLTKRVGDFVEIIVNSEHQQIARFRKIKWYYRYYYQLNELSIPLITLYGNSLAYLFGSTVMIEIIFSISGLGKTLMEAIFSRDYPVIQGITLILACFIFLLNFMVDLLMVKVDGRVTVNS